MQLIKNRQIVENEYRFLADDEEITGEKVVVSFTRWQAEKEKLLDSSERVGVRLNVEDDLTIIEEDLNALSLIELNFLVFTDGRSFSRAKLLRSLGYLGEIRAVGKFMVDQVCYLSKVGFDSFQLENEAQLPVALATLDDFSLSYQA